MSKATITHSTHTLAAESFIQSFDNSNDPIYIFAGRGFPWETKNGVEVVPDVDNSEKTRITTLRNILYAKKISSKDCHLVIKKYTWEPNVVYTTWDIDKNNLYPQFWEDKGSPVVSVFNEQENEYNVYLCINNNNNSISTVCPDNKAGSDIFKNQYQYRTYKADNYTWKWLFTVKNEDNDWKNDEYLLFPSEDEYTDEHKILMENIRTTDELNSIYSIDVIDDVDYHILSETNYLSSDWQKLIIPTVTGNGNSATVEIQMDKLDEKISKTVDGITREYYKYKIKRILLQNFGNSYTFADIDYELGSPTDIMVNKPTLHIVIDNALSITKNVMNFIGVHHVCVKAEYISSENHNGFDYFPTDFTYRQVGIIKNLTNRQGYKSKTDDHISFYDVIHVNNVSKDFEKDSEISGVLSGATSTVLYATRTSDAASSGTINNTALEQTLYVTNTSGLFDTGEQEYIETLKRTSDSGEIDLYSSGNIIKYTQSDISTKFGNLIYIQNTIPISRRESQKEVFLFVIEL